MLYCLGNNDKKNKYTYSAQMQFFPHIFDLWLVLFMDVDPTDTEDQLYTG
jgi:hypothetical protein